MNEELQEELVRRFTKRFQKYNERVLYELGQVIKEMGSVIPSDAYKLAQQLKYNTTIKALEKELSKITGKSIKEIQLILEQVAKDNIQFAKPYYEAKGLNVPIYEKHKELQKLVNSIANLSSNEFVNIARSTGFRLLDNNKKPLLLNIEETYHKMIDEATYAVTTGKDSYKQLMRENLKQLANSGVRKIEYESGYSRRIDTAVRMNLMDSIRQVSNEVQRICGEEFGADGVEITVHQNPAPDHERCQGRQFSHAEFDKFQNHEKCKDYKGNIYNPIENGKQRRRISEYNCYHNINQIVLGVSNPLYSDEYLQEIIDNNHKGVEIDGKHYTNYEATQLQRRIETEIRKAKEQQLLAESSGDEELVSKSQERVRQLKHKYVDISKQANMKTDVSRTYVPNYKEKKIKRDTQEYKDVTNKWINEKGTEKGICKSQNFVIGSDNNKYVVDNKNVILDHTKSEEKIAEWYAKSKKINVNMLPRVLNPPNIKVGDFIEDSSKISWEIKEPEGNSIGTTIPNQFKKQKEKAHKFIIDMHYSDMDINIAIKEIESIMSNKRYEWVEEVVLLKDLELKKVFKR